MHSPKLFLAPRRQREADVAPGEREFDTPGLGPFRTYILLLSLAGWLHVKGQETCDMVPRDCGRMSGRWEKKSHPQQRGPGAHGSGRV